MKLFLRNLALLSAAMFLSGGAHAADSMNPREACREDAKNFCSGIQPGGGRIMDCLWDHYKDISDDCYSALQKMESRRKSQGNGQGNEQGNDGPPPGQHGNFDNGGPPPGPPPQGGSNDN